MTQFLIKQRVEILTFRFNILSLLKQPCALAEVSQHLGPAGFVKKRIHQVDKKRKHCSQCAQNKISHTVIIGIVGHPLSTVPSHQPFSSVFIFLISVPLCLSPPQHRTEQSTGALVEPLLFLL